MMHPPAPNISPVVVDSLGDGFRLRGNPKYAKFPATVDVTIAYADGSARPAWSEYDFTPRDLRLNHQNCSPEFSDNRLKVRDWTEESLVEVMGFDTRRELDTRIRSESNASQN